MSEGTLCRLCWTLPHYWRTSLVDTRVGAQVASLELRTNVLAAYVSGGRAHEVPAVMEAMKIGAGDSFEIAFNTACAALAAGDLAGARAQLEHAQRLGARLAPPLPLFRRSGGSPLSAGVDWTDAHPQPALTVRPGLFMTANACSRLIDAAVHPIITEAGD